MQSPRRFARFLLPLGGLLLAVAAAEVAVRVAGPLIGRARYETWFEDAARQRVDFVAAKDRGLVQLPGLPRGRATWSPNLTFHLCYRGGRRPTMDERGCVRVDINALGLRDRPDLTWEKPGGQRRLVCLGDSFTFGWGVPEELTWVRLVEAELRSRPGGADVRAVNCGAAGTLYIDEYWWGLRDRFHALEPDAVLVTLCLNDVALMPNTVALENPAAGWKPPLPLALLEAAAAAWSFRRRFDLDPAIDWGQVLLDLPPGDPFFAAKSESPEMFWPSGNPQRALREMRDWCRERRVALGVVVWPLFQNLRPGDAYPFRTLHRVVEEFCRAESIPHLDLLATFLGRDPEELWVDPADMHANEIAHALAAPAIARCVAELMAAR